MKKLHRKRIENTIKYISMIHSERDVFEVTTSTTVEEAKQALPVEFNHITEKEGIMLFGRPQRFCHKRRIGCLNSYTWFFLFYGK